MMTPAPAGADVTMQASELQRRDDERQERVRSLQREVSELRGSQTRSRSRDATTLSPPATATYSPVGAGQERVLRELVHEMDLMRSDVFAADTERERALAEASSARRRLDAERLQNSRYETTLALFSELFYVWT